MNILTNICNPKQEHFQQEARTEAYRPINDYIFQSRSMEKMRVRHEAIQNPEQYKYQSWNHPYSISNFFMNQKAVVNGQTKQSLGGTTDYMSHPEFAIRAQESHANKKISFKEIPQAICGIGNEGEQGEKLFTKREDFYASLRANENSYGNGGFSYHGRNYNHEENNFMQHQNARFSRIEHLQNQQQSSQQHHSHILFTQEILRLKQENKDLKRIIEEEYKPMRELYNKLLSEQEQREYLISKLEWKVKELVKEMGAASGSLGNGTNVNIQNHVNIGTKRENKIMSRVESEKKFGKNLTAQPFVVLDTNFANIKIQENKVNTFKMNYQSPYSNQNQYNPINQNEQGKQFIQTNVAMPNGLSNYKKNYTLQSGIQTYQTSYSSPQQFNPYSNQQTGSLQQKNHYTQSINSKIPQHTNFQSDNSKLGQNYPISAQTYLAAQKFSSNPVFQPHYNPINSKFNY